MKLKAGDKATFRAYDGTIITGVVHAVIHPGYYYVAGNGVVCGSYSDGLFRFTDRNIVR